MVAEERAGRTRRVITVDGVYASVEYLEIWNIRRYSTQTFWFTMEI